jgi:hypothetical protein
MTELYGKDTTAQDVSDYESPEEFSGQGDDRIIKNLSFIYEVAMEDAAGNTVLTGKEARHGETVTLEQMGLLGQIKGESSGAFYTTEEREKMEAGENPDAPAASGAGGDVSSMGEYELAEYIKGSNPEGKELTVNETVALAGTDRDLAHRVLQAENIATDGEPRKGVEAGLTAIIESG